MKGDLGIHGAEVAPDGSFVVSGAQARGVPPARYTVTIDWFVPCPGGGQDRDKLNGNHSSQNGVPVTVAPGKELVM